jgi:endonuclease/exonuclease/phosphatase (EEP) superfamily protein YafD
MKILSLNCQKDYNPALAVFLATTLESGKYDFLLLQELTPAMLARHEGQGKYKSLRAFNEEAGKESHLCVLYRSEFVLTESTFVSFNSFVPTTHFEMSAFRAEPGLLAGIFAIGDREVALGSLHLHPGPFPRTRKRELDLVCQSLARFAGGRAVLFAGDCNFGLPGELRSADAITAPSLKRLSRNLPPTLDSRYTEFEPNPINALAVFLARFGLGIRLRTDHVFGSSALVELTPISCRVLPDRVSDHSPIEITFA